MTFARLTRPAPALSALFLAAAVLAVPGVVQAQAGVAGDGITGVNQRCDGGRATITGARNQAVFTHNCSALAILGSNNVVRVALAPGAEIQFRGTGNQVVWVPANPGAPTPPHITVGAEGNVVRREER